VSGNRDGTGVISLEVPSEGGKRAGAANFAGERGHTVRFPRKTDPIIWPSHGLLKEGGESSSRPPDREKKGISRVKKEEEAK